MTVGAEDDVTARVVLEWINGARVGSGCVVFCVDAADARVAGPLLGDGDVLVAPDGAVVESPALVVPSAGAFAEAGDTLHVAGRSVELQHYLAAAFVELVVPTVVRFLDESGWRGFLDDADLARRTGVFSAAVVDPRLRLADREVLLDLDAHERPAALHIDRGGRVRAGAQGATLGSVHDLRRILDTPVPRLSALAGLAPLDVLRGDLDARPWMGRYLRAAELAGALALRPDDERIDGFGWSGTPDARADSHPRTDDPFLVSTGSGILLADLRTRRRQRLSATAATVVAAVQTSSALALAAERVGSTLGAGIREAGALCAEATDRLGVRTGRPFATAGIAR